MVLYFFGDNCNYRKMQNAETTFILSLRVKTTSHGRRISCQMFNAVKCSYVDKEAAHHRLATADPPRSKSLHHVRRRHLGSSRMRDCAPASLRHMIGCTSPSHSTLSIRRHPLATQQNGGNLYEFTLIFGIRTYVSSWIELLVWRFNL